MSLPNFIKSWCVKCGAAVRSSDLVRRLRALCVTRCCVSVAEANKYTPDGWQLVGISCAGLNQPFVLTLSNRTPYRGCAEKVNVLVGKTARIFVWLSNRANGE